MLTWLLLAALWIVVGLWLNDAGRPVGAKPAGRHRLAEDAADAGVSTSDRSCTVDTAS